MSWWADGNNLTVNIINGIATVTCPSDWFGTENIWFIATDSANHSAYVEVLFSKSSNTPPVVSSIPSDTITGTESFNTIALNDYVTDAETSDEKIVWTASKSDFLTVTIANNIATVTPNPLWNGEETIMFIAKDEQGDADTTYATFVRTNAPGSPTGKPIGTFWTEKTLVSVGTPVSFKLNQIGATSYQWTFEGGTPATSQTVDASVAYSAPGIYSVSLVMKNSFGDSTIIKKNIITVMGIKQPDTVICKGNSVTFSLVNATSVDSLVWSNGKKTATITVSPIEETTYAVTLYKGLFSYKDNVKVSIPRPVDLGKDTTVCAGQTVKLYPGIYKKYVWSNLETDESIDAKEIGIYKVSVTDAYSCISEDSVKITALLPLPLTGLPATEHICTAGTKVLTAKNGTEYQWKTDFDSQVWNESSITVSAAGAYIVTVKGENGCSVNDTVTVSSVASPVISISPADTAICPANTVKLTASGAAQYAWDNSVVNGTAFTPAASKTYSVTATDEYGCTSTASAQVTVRATYAQQIGVATFGEDGSSTIVAWNPVRGKKISHVDLQKFNDSSAKFETLKSFGEKDLTYYVDKQADGNLKSYSYRLISYDSLCPAAPATSVIHSTIHLSRDLSVDANMVGLKWNAYAGLDVKKYFIYAIQDGKNVDTLEEGVVDAKKQFYTVTYPRHVNGNKYQIAFDLPEKLYTSTLKNESGPFSQSMSNLSEAIILSDIITDAATVSLYPVPAHDYLDVQSSDVPVSCTVLSMKGESVLTVKGASRIDISQLPAGEYSLRIELSNATVTKLFVKQ